MVGQVRVAHVGVYAGRSLMTLGAEVAGSNTLLMGSYHNLILDNYWTFTELI